VRRGEERGKRGREGGDVEGRSTRDTLRGGVVGVCACTRCKKKKARG